jgi:hypothetical protein
MSRCEACGLIVRWVRSKATGRLVAIDPDPLPDGSIMLLPKNDGARPIPPQQRAACVAPLYRAHVCPSAAGGSP